MQAGAFDQRRMEARDDILVYTSEPFKEGTEVSGPITPTLYVSSDAKDTDFTVKVLDVYPDGRAYNLDESIQRMRYRDGYDKPLVWMEPGKVYKVTLQPLTTSNYFAAGPPAAHRGVEQQLPALRPQPEHRRQQLRREQRRRRAQRGAPLEAVPVGRDGDGRQKACTVDCGTTEIGRGWTAGQAGCESVRSSRPSRLTRTRRVLPGTVSSRGALAPDRSATRAARAASQPPRRQQ